MSATSRPTVGRALSRRQSWAAILCLSLVSGLLFLPATSAIAATGSADLSVSGSVSPDPASGGGAITFALTVHNEGPDPAVGTTLVGDLPSGLRPISASTSAGSCNAAASTVSCDLATIDPGPVDVRVEIVVRAQSVDEETFFDTHVIVTSSTPDLDDTNNELFLSNSVLPGDSDLADLELTAVLNVPSPVTGGYDLGSTATVTNQGSGDATGVTLTDTLAPGESFVAVGSDPSCTESAGVVTCTLGDMASGAVATVLIVTKTPKVAADTTIHDVFAVLAPEDDTPDNDTLDVATAVLARRDDFVAGYVPASRWMTWLNDATQWSHGDPVATIADPTVAFVGIPGGGPGGPVIISELPCGAPFACSAPSRRHGSFSSGSRGVFGNLVHVSVPSGYGPANPIIGVFLDNWSVLGSGWDPFKVSYQNGSTGTPNVLSFCGGWKHTGAPCVSSIGRLFSWWNPYAYADLQTVVRFTDSGTFGRGR
ncbi:MAG: DUF11 domain-containing protein [Actinomycetota bacterium]